MPLDVVETLQSLVRTPSVNPMGREVSGPEYFEYAVTDRLESIFREIGVPHERQSIEPKRENIVARLDGDVSVESGGSLLLFEAHQDTVPIEGMTIDPFSGEVKDGRLYGRGACDIKGGMAAMLAALSRLAEERPAGMPTIVMACTVNEEHGYSGALGVAEGWSNGGLKLLPRRPDLVVVAEPTDLNIVVCHKGVVRWKISTTGRAAHSSNPSAGNSAIYEMARVLSALEVYASDVAPTLGKHPLVGRPTLSVGVIRGGISVNTVPDACTIEVDRRVLPGEDPLAARQAVIDYLSANVRTASPLIHDEPFITATGLADDNNGQLAAALASVASEFGGGQKIGVPYGTDAAVFSKAGAPSVVFGPGSIEQAHTKDEWLDIEELKKAVEVLYRFAKEVGNRS